MTTKTLPPATFHFSDQTVNMAEVDQLAVRLLNETRTISMHVGGHGDVEAVLQIVGEVDGHELVSRDYGMGPEIECACAEFESGKPCRHVTAYYEHMELASAR